ncbi:MAG TPA: NAD(P)-dependent oxidoreductase [Gemmatimonadales bacterium]
MDIGFIGLGAMGRGMAASLIKAGHRVRVWNRSRGPVDELARLGAEPAGEAREAFGGTVITMLADDQAVRDTVLAAGLTESAPAGTVHVNMATVSVALAEELAEGHRRHGIAYVAAPVFGRPDAAAAGQLAIVAAGEDAALDRVQPLFEAMGRGTWRVGREPRQANALKIAGNFMIAAAIEAMGEAATMVERYGVAPARLMDVLTSTLFAAPVYVNYGAAIVERRYEPAGFRLVLGLKDVRLALEAAEAARAPMPMAGLLRDHLLEVIAHGGGDLDWAALAEISRRHAALPDALPNTGRSG